MANTPDAAIEALQATAFTGRCHNVYFRKEQLKSLHDVLRQNTTSIKDAIKESTAVTDTEASIEITLALGIVKEHYESLDPKQELEEEYRIKNGKDAGDKREPWGVVYIEPQMRHTPLFSVVAPLSAAVASGNCAALKFENSLRNFSSLMRTLLTRALESDIFSIVSSGPSSEALSTSLQVLQETSVKHPTCSQLISRKGKVVAIVDRTADLASAAENLVTARFSFGGTSPYAPDLVLVNEFVKKEFLELVLRQAIRFLTSSNGATNSGSKEQKGESRIENTLRRIGEEKNWKMHVITKGDRGAIIEVTNASSKHAPLPSKVNEAIFRISAFTSLDHAIDLVTNDSEERLLAAYHFGSPAHGKYLSQFVKANVSFANHVPFALLVGPSAPSLHPFNADRRYTKEHFTRPSPAYITVPKSQDTLVKICSKQGSEQEARKLLTEATKEIKEPKRAEWIAHGFFEQGIFIGLGLYGVPLLTCIGASIFFGVRAGLRKWAVM